MKSTAKLSVKSFVQSDLDKLSNVYKYLYPDIVNNNVVLQESFQQYSELDILDKRYGSSETKNSRSAYIVAYWVKSGGQISTFNEYELSARPGIIRYLFKHSLIVEGECWEH